MAVPLCQLEGTWEEIVARIPDFSGRKLQVVVFSADAPESGVTLQSILNEIDACSAFMNPKPDVRDYLREGRAGDMFVDQPDR